MTSVGVLKNVSDGFEPGTRFKITLPSLSQSRYASPDQFHILTALLADPKYDELTRYLNYTYGLVDIGTTNLQELLSSGELHVNELKEGYLAVTFSPKTNNFYRVALIEDFDPIVGTAYYQEIDTGEKNTAYLENIFPFPMIEDDEFTDPPRCQKITLANLDPFASSTLLRKYLEESFESAEELSIWKPPALNGRENKSWLIFGSNTSESINQMVIKKICQTPSPLHKIPAGHHTFNTFLTHAKSIKLINFIWKDDPVYKFFDNLILKHKVKVKEAIRSGSELTIDTLNSTTVYFTHFGPDKEVRRAKVKHSLSGNFTLDNSEYANIVYIDFGNEDKVHPSKLVEAKGFNPMFEVIRPLCIEWKVGKMENLVYDHIHLNQNFTHIPLSFVKCQEGSQDPASSSKQNPAVCNIINIANGDVSKYESLEQLKKILMSNWSQKYPPLPNLFIQHSLPINPKMEI